MSTTDEFVTENIGFAIFLHATNSITFLRCESVRPGRSAFVFYDPDQRASSLEMKFRSGAQAPVLTVLATTRFMRAMMRDAQRGEVNVNQ